jgi:hypothetical protein
MKFAQHDFVARNNAVIVALSLRVRPSTVRLSRYCGGFAWCLQGAVRVDAHENEIKAHCFQQFCSGLLEILCDNSCKNKKIRCKTNSTVVE